MSEAKDEEIERDGIKYLFYYSDKHGIIRERYTDTRRFGPEVHPRKSWIVGGPYVLDAITGMGEDPYSCGEWSESWSLEQAQEFAQTHGIDLFGPPDLNYRRRPTTLREVLRDAMRTLFPHSWSD